jgi:hypothetical protein
MSLLISSTDALTATLLLLNLAAGCCAALSLLSMPADSGRVLVLLLLSSSATAGDLRMQAAQVK